MEWTKLEYADNKSDFVQANIPLLERVRNIVVADRRKHRYPAFYSSPP